MGTTRSSGGRAPGPRMMVVRASLLTCGLAGALALAPVDKEVPTAEPPLLPLGTAWTTPLAAAPAAPPAIDESQLYVPLETGELAALSFQTGEARWQARLPTRHAPVAAEGRVIAADESSLEAVRAADGTALWKTPLDAAPVRGLQDPCRVGLRFSGLEPSGGVRSRDGTAGLAHRIERRVDDAAGHRRGSAVSRSFGAGGRGPRRGQRRAPLAGPPRR